MSAEVIYTQTQDGEWEAQFEGKPNMVAVGKTKDEAYQSLVKMEIIQMITEGTNQQYEYGFVLTA
jgi:predicted RNase H-like HicB family nuclease